MPKKKSDKKIECFSASFNDILICQNNAARPYMEVFVSEPENVAQQNLGTLAGILEITDDSEDSSYIVNYLVSVIKKEYYSRVKRGTIESFEAALKKANLALAKLAEHENITWIGHTNAILLVIEKNNLHLSTSGNAHALLLRGKTLTDISDGGVAEETPNPIKTFTDIVSGRLEENDKLIVTTEAMFDIFSLEEIKKSAVRFSSEEFIQFLKTALVNELERAVALVVEVRKEEKKLPEPTESKNRNNFNAFSQTAFSKKSPAKKVPAKNDSETLPIEEKSITTVSAEERHILAAEIKEGLVNDRDDFVDKKTGHIYIKENYPAPEEELNFLEHLDAWQDKLSGYLGAILEFIQTFNKKIRAVPLPRIPNIKKTAPLDSEDDFADDFPESGKEQLIEEKHIPIKEIPAETKLEEAENRFLFFWKENYPKVKDFLSLILAQLIRVTRTAFRVARQKTQQLISRTQEFWRDTQQRKSTPLPTHIEPPSPSEPQKRIDWMEKYHQKLSATTTGATSAISTYAPKTFRKVLPRFSRLRNILDRLDYTQRIYVALALVLLFIVPYFLAKIGAKPTPKVAPVEKTASAPLALAKDKNVVRVEKINPVYSADNIDTLINLNGSIFAVSATGVVDVANKTSYPFPNNFTPTLSAGMDDLNFLFFLGQDNQVLSWSPLNKNFQTNVIAIPGNTKFTAIGTYLTYLYLLDSANNKIYRYPRDTGGFGEKTDWLKEPIDLAQTKSMAIGENIYLNIAGTIAEFLQGKKQTFALGATATPIAPDELYTKRDDQYLYILDKVNSRIIKTDLAGQIISQYYNAEIKNATAFTVDETNSLIYVSTPTEIGTFGTN